MIVPPPPYTGPTPPELLAALAQHARATALDASSSAAYADAWWDAAHTAFSRSPHEEAATGWSGYDRVVRYVNQMAMGGP